MKKITLFMMAIGMWVLLTACQAPLNTLNPQEKVEQMIRGMTNYEAQAQITFTKNKKSSTIKVKQVYDQTGKYELTILEPEHVKGYKTTHDGEKITEYSPINDKSVQVQVSPVKNQVLFGTFVHNYLESGTITPSSQGTGDEVILEADIPGNYKYMAHEKAWFDQKTGAPKKIEIYGQDGALTITIEFLTFKYNIQTK